MSAKRDEYTAKMKHQLDELNKKVDAIEAKAGDAAEDARATYRAELAKLRHHADLAKAQFAEMKAASESSWDKVVAETEKVRDAFSRSFHYFKSQL
ncbi:MAG: hypothetical protein ABI702_07990 [Burkholderiales bacterium]